MIKDKKYYQTKSNEQEQELQRLRIENGYLGKIVDLLKSRPAIYDDAVTSLSRSVEANAHIVNDVIRFLERRN
jgi:type IV secretory pathway protease TraF